MKELPKYKLFSHKIFEIKFKKKIVGKPVLFY